MADCHLEVLDENGNVLFEGRTIENYSPSVEGARDGVMWAEYPEDVEQATDARMACNEWRYEPPPEPPQPPEGPMQVVESGRFTDDWGNESGKPWYVVSRADDEEYCWQFHVGELEEIEDSLAGGTCIPRRMKLDEHLLGWGFSQAEDRKRAVASGQISGDVARVEVRFDDGRVVAVDPLAAPAEADVPTRYFVAFLPGTRGEIVVLDAQGEVLERHRLCPERCVSRSAID